MTPRSLAGLALTVAALMSAFVLMAPTAPGLFVGVLTVGTFGFGPFYGEPSRQLVDRPWRRDTRWRDLARRVRTDWLSRQLGAVGWNAAISRRITGRADLRRIRTAAVGSLVSHAASAGLHAVAGVALAAVGHPVWAWSRWPWGSWCTPGRPCCRSPCSGASTDSRRRSAGTSCSGDRPAPGGPAEHFVGRIRRMSP